MKQSGRRGCGLAVVLALFAADCSSTASTLSGPSPAKCAVATTLSPATVGADGGSARATVSAARECAWTASSEAAWVLITDGQSGQGDGSVSLDVAANPSAAVRTANISVNDQHVALTQDAAPCRFTLNRTSATFDSQGGSDSVVVTTASLCEWTATSLAPWISITAGATGSGSGTVAFAVARASGDTRRGEILIAGQTFTVQQAAADTPPPPPPPPGCTYSISPAQVSAPATGGAFVVTVSTQTGCAWTATSATPWLTVGNGSGVGSGTLQIDAAANLATTARTGNATIAGQTFTVQQAAADAPPPPPPSCTYSISPTQVSAPATGGAFVVTVNTQTGCAWTATSATPWLTVGNGSGVGSGTVQIDAAANLATAARTGNATIAGQTFTVQQAAADAPPPPPPSCTYSISPTQASVPGAGGSFTTMVDTLAGCAWTAASNVSWLTVAPGGGAGDGTVQITASANPSPSPRTGTASIAGTTLTVDQAGTPPPCTFRIAPTEARISWNEQSLSVSVDTQSGCTWRATPTEGWIEVTGGSSGSGPGVVRLNVRDNRSRNERTGTVTIAGEVFSILQAGRISEEAFGALPVASLLP